MKAAVFYGPRNVKIEEIGLPKAGEGELVIRILVSNVCGTDLRTWQGGHPLMRPPVVIGHEYYGIVKEVGRGVKEFRAGDEIVGSNSCPCMKCVMCNTGSLTLCEEIPKNLIGFSIPGSHAEYMRVPAHIVKGNIYHAPKGVAGEEIACSEPLAAAIHALDKLSIKEGMRVAVLGSGALGLMFLQLLKRTGVYVVMTDGMVGRLKIAERLGADKVIEVTQGSVVTPLKEATDGLGPDLVIEATGTKQAWENAFRAARDGGKVLLFGGCPGGTQVSFDATKLHYREITILGSFHHEPREFRKAIDAISKGTIRVKDLISLKLPLSQIGDAFEMMEKKEALKVAISP